jgi:hypothetical protein
MIDTTRKLALLIFFPAFLILSERLGILPTHALVHRPLL